MVVHVRVFENWVFKMNRIELKQNLKLTQQLVMTPKLQLAIKMLTMNNLELAEVIRQEITENPIIDDEPPIIGEKSENTKADESFDDASYFKEIKDYVINYDEQLRDLSKPINLDGKQDKNYILENSLIETDTLYEFIMDQVRTGDFTEDEIRLCEYIAGNLDSDGFLTVSKQELENYAGDRKLLLEPLLYKMSRLEPVGIAVCDAVSSLLVQADYFFPDDRLLKEIIKDYLKDVANGNNYKILKETGAPVSQVEESISRLKTLNPRPAVNFGQAESRYIVPDLYLRKINGKYAVFMEDDSLPPIKISSYYKKILNGEIESSAITKDYIEEKLKSVMWLIKSIKTRKETILKIANSIVERQTDFFDKGRGNLKPLILKTIASELGLHESTVSRATSNKYLSTHLGVFELKDFFSGSAYGDVSSDYIMLRIKEIVETEKVTGKIYSDSDIMVILKKAGINIARRTIAKYRDIMDIPPSNRRK